MIKFLKIFIFPKISIDNYKFLSHIIRMNQSSNDTYIYWDNSKGWHTAKLLTVEADTIELADKIFKQVTGLDPIKNNLAITTQP